MSEVISVGAIVVFLMLMFYMAMGTVIERYKWPFGHEASFTILLGMLVSFIAYEEGHRKFVQLLKFSDSTFFYFCLPPIVFSSGYNMQRGDFFANIKNISIFGVLSTFLCFSVFSFITIVVKNRGFMMEIDGKTGKWAPLDLTDAECLLMCSLLCSSDVIAAVSLISYDKQPKLFSIVFGEGIINDAVSIILFNTVMKYTSENNEITSSTPFAIAKDFFDLGTNSLIIGVMFGLGSALLLKTYRAFSRNPIVETSFLFCIAYLSYVTSEMMKSSGIISLLVSGIVMAHYTFYNLSAPGKHSTFFVFEFLGYASEAFVFAYLGLTFFSYFELKWSPHLFCVELIVIVIGRFCGVFVTIALFSCCCGYKSGLELKELIFCWYAGMIRGAIAFGLVLRIDEKQFSNRDVIVTTSLSLVVFTTIAFGSTVGLLQRCLFPEEPEEPRHKVTFDLDNIDETTPRQREEEEESPLAHANTMPQPNIQELEGEEEVSSSSSSSEDSVAHAHPNLQRAKKEAAAVSAGSEKPVTEETYTGAMKFMYIFDEKIMKPIFIYKYNKILQKQAIKMYTAYIDHGNEIERDAIIEAVEEEKRELEAKGIKNKDDSEKSDVDETKKEDLDQYLDNIKDDASDGKSQSIFSRQLTKRIKKTKKESLKRGSTLKSKDVKFKRQNTDFSQTEDIVSPTKNGLDDDNDDFFKASKDEEA